MRTVLIVEDYDDIREAFAELLQDHGYRVLEAANGLQALELLDRSRPQPSLMLLDLMMPVMDGQQLLRILDAQGRLAALPVIVLSAGGNASDVPQARRFLRKPPSEAVLLQLVDELSAGAAEA